MTEEQARAYGRALYDDEVTKAVAYLRWLLDTPTLDGAARVDVFDRVVEGYCRHCGERGQPCQCENDE